MQHARTPWLIVGLVMAAGTFGSAQIGKLPGVLPTIRIELGLDLVASGWLISTISAVGVVTATLWGAIADRVGRRRVLVGALAVVGIASIVGAYSVGFTPLLLARIAEGVGYIAIVVVGPVFLAPLATERDRPIALGIWAFYMPIGMAGAVILAPGVAETHGWRGLWIAAGILPLLLCVWMALATRKLPRRNPDETDRPALLTGIRQTLQRPGIWVLAVSFGAYSLIYLSVNAFLPTFLIERRGVDPETAGLMVGLAIFMNAPGCFVGAWFMKRRFAPWLVILAGYVGMFVCAAGVYHEGLGGDVRYILALLLPFFGGFVPPTVLARNGAHAASPALIATSMGLIVQFVSLGQLIGPPILGALVSATGEWQSALWLTGSASAVGVAMALLLRRIERKMID